MIRLKCPKNGEKVELLTTEQRKFLATDRSNITSESFDYLNLKKHSDEDCSFPQSVRLEWEAEEIGTVHISENENFDVYDSKIGRNSCDLVNLKCGTRYFWRVVCADAVSETFYFDTADRYPRFIKVEGLTNLRDCGGWKTASGKRIKQGLLYRGSEMNSHLNITADGIKTMEEVLKIKSVLDLRGKTEIVEDVYKRQYTNIPAAAYSDWFKHPHIMREIFAFLSDEKNYPVYFHCWGGADRTGTLAFLLGALLGQRYEDLIDDYEITSLSVWGPRTRNSKEHFEKFFEMLDAFAGDSLEQKVRTYLISCGISETRIDKFCNFMLC